MDQAPLVSDQIEHGRELILRLAKRNAGITAAFWAKMSDGGRWLLCIAWNAIDEGAISKSYRTVQEALGKMHYSAISLSEVKLLATNEPVTVAVRGLQRAESDVRVPGDRLGDAGIDEAYIYARKYHDILFSPDQLEVQSVGVNRNGASPSSWFADFVELAVDAFNRLDEHGFKEAPFQKKVDTILAQKIVVPTFIGDVGERFVWQQLSKLGYQVIRTRGSRSPANVWGCGKQDGVTHLPLIQVRATRKDHPADAYAFEDAEKLDEFGIFVADLIVNAKGVPQEIRDSPFLISVGRAEVVVDWLTMNVAECEVVCLGSVGSRDVSVDWAKWGGWLDEYYKSLNQ